MQLGVYETMRTFDGIFALLNEHEARLKKSCKMMGILCPNLEQIVAPYEGKSDVRLKVIVEAMGAVHVEEETLPKWDGNFLFNKSWKVKFVEGERKTPIVKHLDTSFQISEREKAIAEGFDEIVMVSPEGFVREGGITNIFFWDGKKLITPASGILEGIGRSLVSGFARENGILVEERDVKFLEIENGLGEFFLVNSIRGIVPVIGAEEIIKKLSALIGNFISQKIEERKHKIRRNN